MSEREKELAIEVVEKYIDQLMAKECEPGAPAEFWMDMADAIDLARQADKEDG